MKKFGKIIGIGIGVVAALVITASTTQAQNLLTDGSFENGSFVNTVPVGSPLTVANVGQGWAANFGGSGVGNSDMSSSPDSPQDGNYALLTVNNPGNNWNPQGTYQIVNANAGGAYSLSAWFLTDTGSSSPIGPVDIQLQFLDGALAKQVGSTPPQSTLGLRRRFPARRLWELHLHRCISCSWITAR